MAGIFAAPLVLLVFLNCCVILVYAHLSAFFDQFGDYARLASTRLLPTSEVRGAMAIRIELPLELNLLNFILALNLLEYRIGMSLPHLPTFIVVHVLSRQHPFD